MEQYIKKSDIVAEIKRRISVLEVNESVISMLAGGMFVNEFKDLLSFLDTLEVKEIDLGREIEKEIETRWRGEYLFTSKFRESAKHFFELGLNAQKGE